MERAHDIRPVRIERDAAEADGFALGTEPAAGHVKAGQRRICRRHDLDFSHQGEPVRDGMDHETLFRLLICGRVERRAVEGDGEKLQVFAIENEGLPRLAGAAQFQFRTDLRCIRIEIEAEIHLFDFERIGRVVGKVHGNGARKRGFRFAWELRGLAISPMDIGNAEGCVEAPKAARRSRRLPSSGTEELDRCRG